MQTTLSNTFHGITLQPNYQCGFTRSFNIWILYCIIISFYPAVSLSWKKKVFWSFEVFRNFIPLEDTKIFGWMHSTEAESTFCFLFTFSPLVDTKAFGWMHGTEAESIFWFAFILQRGVWEHCYETWMRFLLLFFFHGLSIRHDNFQFISIASLVTWLPQMMQLLASTKIID